MTSNAYDAYLLKMFKIHTENKTDDKKEKLLMHYRCPDGKDICKFAFAFIHGFTIYDLEVLFFNQY
jgi:hypothetical protein